LNNIVIDTKSGRNKSLFLRAVSSGNVYRDIPLIINYWENTNGITVDRPPKFVKTPQ
jgi:hypothetical protein